MLIEDKDIETQKLVIDLEFVVNAEYDEISSRKYYLLEYKDNSQKLLYTTNEPDEVVFEDEEFWHECHVIDTLKKYVPDNLKIKPINQEFTKIEDFEQLINSFENSNFLNYHLKKGFNTPPKYIYYNIKYIDKDFIPMFLKHLKENTSGYVQGDLTKDEELQIWFWFDYLNENNKDFKNH